MVSEHQAPPVSFVENYKSKTYKLGIFYVRAVVREEKHNLEHIPIKSYLMIMSYDFMI